MSKIVALDAKIYLYDQNREFDCKKFFKTQNDMKIIWGDFSISIRPARDETGRKHRIKLCGRGLYSSHNDECGEITEVTEWVESILAMLRGGGFKVVYMESSIREPGTGFEKRVGFGYKDDLDDFLFPIIPTIS